MAMNSMFGGGTNALFDMKKIPSTDEAYLDPCCQRELESNRRRNAIENTLRSHDIVAARERRRRNLVTIPDQFTGCRCSYDPNCDGGEYRSLIELRAKKTQEEEEKQQPSLAEAESDFSFEEKKDDFSQRNDENIDKEDDDSDFDYLLDDPDLPGEENKELKMLEDIRRAELEYEILRQEVAMQHGFGVLRHMHPSRILRAAGLAPGSRDPPIAVVVHLVDPDSVASASLDLHLEKLAPVLGRGTKFMRSGGRTVLTFDSDLAAKVLPRMQMDRDIPALVAVRDGVVVNVCAGLLGLTEIGGSKDGEIIPEAVEQWLHRSGVLIGQTPEMDAMCLIRPEEEALMDYLSVPTNFDSQEKRFVCGVPNCSKAFAHEHVGIQNEEQRGLIVSENDVYGLNMDN